MSGATPPAPPPSPPEFFSTNTLWLDSDAVVKGFLGDGTLISYAQNRGTETDTIVMSDAGAPTWFERRYNGGSCLRFGAAQAAKVLGGAICALVNGKTASQINLDIGVCWQTRHSDAMIVCGWGKDGGATDRGLVLSTGLDTYKPQITGGTNAAKTAIPAATHIEYLCPSFTLIHVEGDGDDLVITYYHDGVAQAEQRQTWAGTFDVDTFGIGCVATTGEALGAEWYLTDLFVRPGELDAGQRTEVEQYIGERRGFKHKLVEPEPGEDWLIIVDEGASNCEGFGSVTHTGYAIEADPNCFYMAKDGFLKALVLNTSDGVNHAAPDLAFLSPTYTSRCESQRKQMRLNGETRKILFVPCAMSSTDSNDWSVGRTSNPPTIDNLTGHMKHRVRDALKAPGASLLFFYDGAGSNCQSAGEVTDWSADWSANLDERNSYFSGKFDLTDHFFFGRLALNLTAPMGFANIADMRTAELALESGRSDVVLVQSPDGHDALGGADGIHLTGTEQQAYGVLVADAIDAAT